MEEKLDMKGESSGLLGRGETRKKSSSTCRCLLLLCVLLFIVLAVGIALGVGLGLGLRSGSGFSGTYQRAAVATDAQECSEVGVKILRDGGSAVDAAIASLLCVGVINLQSTGIGGGGFMMYYNATAKTTSFIDYREVAPKNATSDMYNGNPKASLLGGLAIAVPGELKGLELASKKYGQLDWKALLQPAIDIADEGFEISEAIADAIEEVRHDLETGKYPGLQKLLMDENNVTLKKGDKLQRKEYANTLRKVQDEGADYFYNSNFTTETVEELKSMYGSIITEEDLNGYSVEERETVETVFEDLTLAGTSAPGGGPVLALILNILAGYNFTSEKFDGLAYHQIVEAFKFAYAQRIEYLGDPAFNATVDEVVKYMINTSTADAMRARIQDNTTHDPSYYYQHDPLNPDLSSTGTSHLSVLAENGDAVAATSTVNGYFGSLVLLESSGVIFNNEMNDFAIPGENCSTCLPDDQPNNGIQGGKRAQSSMSPSILTDAEGKVRMVVGAAGGTKIITVVAQVILDVLSFGKALSDAVPYPRLHHQLEPDYVSTEKDFPEEFVEALKTRNHKVEPNMSRTVVQGIHVDSDGKIHATSDYRKGGKPDGY